MSNVIQFPTTVMQQFCKTKKEAENYVMTFLGKGDFVTANLVEIDGMHVVTIFPREELIAEAVRNARKEWVS